MAKLDPWLANLLASQGIGQTEVKVAKEQHDKVRKTTPTEEDMLDSAQRTQFRGEGVVRSLECPLAEKIVKECKRKGCGRVFATNYTAVGYCSMRCTELDLKERFGMAWIPHRDMQRERWEIRTEPYIITEEALIAMKLLVQDVENRLGRSLDTGPQREFPNVTVGQKQEISSPQFEDEPLAEQPSLASPKQQAPEIHSSRMIEETVPAGQSLEELLDL